MNKRKEAVRRVSVALVNRLRKVVDKKGNQVGHPIINLGLAGGVEELIPLLEERYRERYGEELDWDDFGTSVEVEHVRPLKAFDLTNRDEYCAAVIHTNLELLKREDNRKKGASWKDE